jgi:hypothetical protein
LRGRQRKQQQQQQLSHRQLQHQRQHEPHPAAVPLGRPRRPHSASHALLSSAAAAPLAATAARSTHCSLLRGLHCCESACVVPSTDAACRRNAAGDGGDVGTHHHVHAVACWVCAARDFGTCILPSRHTQPLTLATQSK